VLVSAVESAWATAWVKVRLNGREYVMVKQPIARQVSI